MTTRTCKWRECRRTLITQRADAEFCSDSCRTRHKNEVRKQSATDTRVNGQESGVGSRGGNVRELDEARGLQEEQKEKARWTLIVREQIIRTLLDTGYFHADDLDALGVPPAFCNTRGSQIGSFRRLALMEKTGVERKVAHAAANGRKTPIFRISAKGRKVLPGLLKDLAGVRTGVLAPQGPGGESPDAPIGASADSSETSTNPGKGQAHSNGATLDRPASSQDDSPVGARLLDDGVKGSSTARHEAVGEPEPLSLLPEPDPEAWAA